MKIEKRELEVVLIPENDYEGEALASIKRARVVTARTGGPSESSWGPDRLRTNLVLCLPSLES